MSAVIVDIGDLSFRVLSIFPSCPPQLNTSPMQLGILKIQIDNNGTNVQEGNEKVG